MSLPQVPFGNYRMSRLIIGGNPFSGNSHLSQERDREMVDYYSVSNIKQALFAGERNGINTMQCRADPHIIRMIIEYRNEGGTLQWIAQTASEMKDLRANIMQTAKLDPIAIYHHGTQTDNFWRTGRMDELRECLKWIRDRGIMVGVGTHIPEVIENIEASDWDVDFYMASAYNVYKDTKGVRESYLVSGKRGKEHYDEEDVERMGEVIKMTEKPCLFFKILAAGRKAKDPITLRKSFERAFRVIKDTDAVVVGMFQRDRNEVEQNAALVREICGD